MIAFSDFEVTLKTEKIKDTLMEKKMDKPKIAQKAPYEIEMAEGKKYAWCACGHSENQPFCDGSHKGTGHNPVIGKMEKAETVYFCGCKQTGNHPFCDGTHNKLD